MLMSIKKKNPDDTEENLWYAQVSTSRNNRKSNFPVSSIQFFDNFSFYNLFDNFFFSRMEMEVFGL